MAISEKDLKGHVCLESLSDVMQLLNSFSHLNEIKEWSFMTIYEAKQRPNFLRLNHTLIMRGGIIYILRSLTAYGILCSGNERIMGSNSANFYNPPK
jgi:hypothetical protein